mmetsp:Transcript_26572/g.57622  ORF Transcript_26572/g.57622 Transcript_26572/m.57622 type:complete len:89 (-) Transcript_26572:128-394(-)
MFMGEIIVPKSLVLCSVRLFWSWSENPQRHNEADTSLPKRLGWSERQQKHLPIQDHSLVVCAKTASMCLEDFEVRERPAQGHDSVVVK